MTIREILRDKGHEVVTIEESDTVHDAVRVLVAHDIGSVVAIQGRRLAGILTERDILRLTARLPGLLGDIRVGAAMTCELVTATPDQVLQEAMSIMIRRKIRHLPILEDGRLVGIVSIGDLLHACRMEAERENDHMRGYIQGTA